MADVCDLVKIIDETECIGTSLATINSNFANLDRGLCEVNTDLKSLSGFVYSLSAKDSPTIDMSVAFSPRYFLSADVINNSIGTVKLGVDIPDVTKTFLQSAKLSAIADVTITNPQDNQYLVWQGNKWVNDTVDDDPGIKQLSGLHDVSFKVKNNPLEDGQILKWNKAQNKWVNGPDLQNFKVPKGLYDDIEVFDDPGYDPDTQQRWVIREGKVGTLELADLAVTPGKLANDAVITRTISALAVTREKIADLAVNSDKLADNAVTGAKIKDREVNSDKLANNSVIATKISAEAITQEKLATNAVTTRAIENFAVNHTKLANDSVTTRSISAAAVTTDKIKDFAVNNNKLAENAVTNTKVLRKNANYQGITLDKCAFDVGEINTGRNIGASGSQGIFAQKSGATLEFRGIAASPQTGNALLVNLNNNTNTVDLFVPTATAPVPATGANLGSIGLGIYSETQSTDGNLKFKRLVAGNGISLSENDTSITISTEPQTLGLSLVVQDNSNVNTILTLVRSIYPPQNFPGGTRCNVDAVQVSGGSSSGDVSVTCPLTIQYEWNGNKNNSGNYWKLLGVNGAGATTPLDNKGNSTNDIYTVQTNLQGNATLNSQGGVPTIQRRTYSFTTSLDKQNWLYSG